MPFPIDCHNYEEDFELRMNLIMVTQLVMLMTENFVDIHIQNDDVNKLVDEDDHFENDSFLNGDEYEVPVGNYICIIYIFIGVNGNEGVCRTFATFQVAPLRNHCNFSSCNPYEPLQFFMLHPLVSYKFRTPPFTNTYIFSCI